jgi:putative glutamine amidotransferase
MRRRGRVGPAWLQIVDNRRVYRHAASEIPAHESMGGSGRRTGREISMGIMAAMAPLIGIPTCLDDRGRWKANRDYHYIDNAYASAIESAGGTPIYLPIQRDPSALLKSLDGLLIPGGDDLPPELDYPSGVEFDLAPEEQLNFDRHLLTDALQRRLPVLGICYGMQLLAAIRGGALVYDIPTDRPQSGLHQLPEADGRHALQVEGGTRLYDALGANPPPVNSLHHQGVASPGTGMRIAAHADDGLIEAIEDEEQRFCMGVQWHPEKLSGAHRDQLFGAFVAACG